MGKDVTSEYGKYLITKNFDIEENDIEDWSQDILDEYPDLDLIITYYNKDKFYIYLFSPGIKTDYKTKYPINLKHIKFINERLRERGCCLVNYSTELDSWHDLQCLVGYTNDRIYLKVVTFDYLR